MHFQKPPGPRFESLPLTGTPAFSQQVDRSFPVRFGYNQPGASEGIYAGKIHIDSERIHVSGSRPRLFWFSQSEERNFSTDNVINVKRTGKDICFELKNPPREHADIWLVAENEHAAARIVKLLPKTRTLGFAKVQVKGSPHQPPKNFLKSHASITSMLVAINLLVFFAMFYSGIDIFKPDSKKSIDWGSNFGPLTIDGEWWRLFTGMFIHFGIVHLGFNMIALYQNGRIAEHLFGHVRFLLLYFFAGLTGSIISVLWHPTINSAGASGAIFGVFGGMLAFFMSKRTDIPAAVIATHRNSTLFFIGFSLFYGFVHTGIDNAAHLGGLAGGFVAGLALARPSKEGRRFARKGYKNMAFGILALASTGILSYFLMHPSHNMQQELMFQRELTSINLRERKALAEGKQLVMRISSGKIKEPIFLKEIDHSILPQWEEMYTSMAAPELSPESTHYPLQQAFLRYLDDRRRAWKLFASGIRHRNSAELLEAEQAKKDAEFAVSEIQRIIASR